MKRSEVDKVINFIFVVLLLGFAIYAILSSQDLINEKNKLEQELKNKQSHINQLEELKEKAQSNFNESEARYLELFEEHQELVQQHEECQN